MIKEIKDSLLIQIANILPSYKKADFAYDINSNKFNSQAKRFYVKIKSANITSGSLGVTTLNHTFEIGITDSYQSPNKLTDDAMSDLIAVLQDTCLSLYKELELRNKTIHPNIMIVNSLSIGEPSILSEERVINQSFTINVKYHS